MTAPATLGNSLIVSPGQQGPPGVPGPAGDWQVVTFSLSPYQMVTTLAWLLVDTTGGAVTLDFPTAANSPNSVFIVDDRFGTAHTNNITLVCPAGVTSWNPSAPGTYASTVTINSAAGLPVRFKFSTALQIWLPW